MPIAFSDAIKFIWEKGDLSKSANSKPGKIISSKKIIGGIY